MKLTFIGADHEVTGSCHFVSVGKVNFIVDCGMEQGPDMFENQELPVSPSDIDYIFLTHAHIDHSGLIPLMYVKGFRGKIFCTEPTKRLCSIMLKDSAHIQEFEAGWRTRKAKRAGQDGYTPLYTVDDAEKVMRLFCGIKYSSDTRICDEISVRFTDIGHLLGSAAIEFTLKENGVTKKIVFSGDIGNTDQPLILDPQTIGEADYVLTECTYGDRDHSKVPDYPKELAGIIQRTFDRGGNLIIPSFAVGRTQQLLYYIRKIKEDKLVRNHDFEVYLDSPLAIEATSIYSDDVRDCLDSEALSLLDRGINPISFKGLHYLLTSEDSRKINELKAPKVIISASGMCEAGRIRHHLKHNLWRKECTVLFVGYQCEGTLGRSLLDGAKEVRLFGEDISVKAEILKLEGVSAHADKSGLIRWLNGFTPKPKKVFVVHGEASVCDTFTETLMKDCGFDAYAPYSGAEFDLITGRITLDALKTPKKKVSEATARKNAQFERLLAAGRRLMSVIYKNREISNKDSAKFAGQINSLCDKWED